VIGYWLLCFGPGIYVVFGAVFVLSSDRPLFGSTVFDSMTLLALSTTPFIILPTLTRFVLSLALTSMTIRLFIYIAGFYDMRLLSLEKEGLGMLVWLE
jgi:hypothetical protein